MNYIRQWATFRRKRLVPVQLLEPFFVDIIALFSARILRTGSLRPFRLKVAHCLNGLKLDDEKGFPV